MLLLRALYRQRENCCKNTKQTSRERGVYSNVEWWNEPLESLSQLSGTQNEWRIWAIRRKKQSTNYTTLDITRPMWSARGQSDRFSLCACILACTFVSNLVAVMQRRVLAQCRCRASQATRSQRLKRTAAVSLNHALLCRAAMMHAGAAVGGGDPLVQLLPRRVVVIGNSRLTGRHSDTHDDCVM